MVSNEDCNEDFTTAAPMGCAPHPYPPSEVMVGDPPGTEPMGPLVDDVTAMA